MFNVYLYSCNMLQKKRDKEKGGICNMSIIHDFAVLPSNAYDSMLGSHMRQRWFCLLNIDAALYFRSISLKCTTKDSIYKLHFDNIIIRVTGPNSGPYPKKTLLKGDEEDKGRDLRLKVWNVHEHKFKTNMQWYRYIIVYLFFLLFVVQFALVNYFF